ncbi:MAG: Rad52/Rad22 family DNA repair protein [Burkholderiaceae bacterium]
MKNVRSLTDAMQGIAPGAVEPRQVLDPKIQESIVLRGDLSGLNEAQKKEYYLFRCKQVGLDAAAKPFDLLKLNGKEILYANAGATQQLCSIHRLSTQITHRERIDDIYIVSVRVTAADGRVSENQGAVSVGSARGDALANAILKATTKAIRRAVLAHCGLGMMDETEVETIPEARVMPMVITEDVKPTEQVQEGIVFMVPGAKEAYARYATNDDWVGGFLDMVEKIENSKKFSISDKMARLDQLEEANSFIVDTIRTESKASYMLLSDGIGKVKQRLALELRKESE